MPDGQRTEDGKPGRALVVAPTPYYVEKGSTLRVHSMVKRLVDAGYAVDVVCYDRGNDPGLSNVTVSRAGIRSIAGTDVGPSLGDLVNDAFVAASTLRKVLSNDYDVVQGEDVEGIAIALIAARFTDAETVYDLHNPLTENLRINGVPVPEAVSRAIEGVLYRGADRVIANWSVWAEAIESRFGIDHVETVHDELRSAKRHVDLPAERYVAYVGNFERYQGVDLLVDGFAAVAAETDVDLLLVGEPTDEVRRAVTASPVEDRIHLVGRQDVPAANAIIAGAVATVVPRRSGEQPGSKLIHYTMHDPPIVATNLDCNRELERFDNTVVWADPTPESLGEGIREVCRDA